MAYIPKDGDIAVYAVKEKKNPKGPDFTGRALIDGVEKDVSLWWKSETMLAGQVQPKWVPNYQETAQAVENTQVQSETHGQDIEEDEIPF